MTADRTTDLDARPRLVLVTGHYLRSDRKAGFHWLADAFNRLGFSVTMVTAGISWMSELRRDYRTRYGLRKRRFRRLDESGEISSVVWFTPWHPGNLRFAALNAMAAPLFRTYGGLPLGDSEDVLRSADVVVFDTGPGLFLVERTIQMNPNALLLLRASDDLRAMKQHKVLLDVDSRVAHLFDDVSVPSAGVGRCYPPPAETHLDRHGIAKSMFDNPGASPYASFANRYRAHAVFVGNGFFDHEFLKIASQVAPEIAFHIIGPISGLCIAGNVFAYGELPFDSTVPFVAHADLGLHTLDAGEHSSTFSDSLKTRQYTYCRLPIIAPVRLPVSLPHVFSYERSTASIRAALTGALQVDRNSADPVQVDDWTDLAARIVRRGALRRTALERPSTELLNAWSRRSA